VKEFVKPKESVLRLFPLNSVADISSRAAEPASLSFTMNKRRLSNEKVTEQRIEEIKQGAGSAHCRSPGAREGVADPRN
jgi:hypothetical protein